MKVVQPHSFGPFYPKVPLFRGVPVFRKEEENSKGEYGGEEEDRRFRRKIMVMKIELVLCAIFVNTYLQ